MTNKFSGGDAAAAISRDWRENPRWRNITRGYSAEDVVRLRGSVRVEHSIATLTANKLWQYLQQKPFVNSLGALTGNQAMQQVKAGLDAIYLSGWQVAGDANLSGTDVSRTSPSTRPIPCRPWPAHQQLPVARGPDLSCEGNDHPSTGSSRSSRTPRRASAGCSTRSS